MAIAKCLEELPESFTKELYETKSDVLFQHIYEKYLDDGSNPYTAV